MKYTKCRTVTNSNTNRTLASHRETDRNMQGGCGSGSKCLVIRRFNSPGVHADMSLGKTLNPKLLLMWSAWQQLPSVYECMYYCKSLWTKESDRCPKCECNMLHMTHKLWFDACICISNTSPVYIGTPYLGRDALGLGLTSS